MKRHEKKKNKESRLAKKVMELHERSCEKCKSGKKCWFKEAKKVSK